MSISVEIDVSDFNQGTIDGKLKFEVINGQVQLSRGANFIVVDVDDLLDAAITMKNKADRSPVGRLG